uniref:NTR domain-containing protein n=1 Tax=Caenorhabditis japonica TaxID=281687 RepID=A0A8R1EI25_CAEJA
MILFAFIIVFFTLPHILESCSCVELRSDTDGYCTTDWISKVKIVSKETDGLGLMMSYRLEHLDVIKSPENVTLPELMNTATQESACGQTKFKVGKEYILAGSSASNDSLLITFCNWRVPLKYIDETKLELKKPEWKAFVDSVKTCPQRPVPVE